MLRKLMTMGATVVVAVGVMVTSGSAITIGDGSLDDWGITNITNGYESMDDVNKSKSGTYSYGSYTVSYWEENGVVPGSGMVGPGYGGQQFDIEGLYLTYDSSYLYVAATVGIPQTGSVAPNPGYYIGDFALSIDGSYDPSAPPVYGFEYGIETMGSSAGALYNVTSWQPAIFYPSSNPYNMNVATQVASSLGFSYSSVGPELYLIETRISLASLPSITGPVTLSLTQSCGNDSGRLTATVPEPATLLLLGGGLLGLAALNRRKRIL